MDDLKGKSILVTGASSGIGRAIAIECSKKGAKLIITGRNEIRLKDTLDNLLGIGHKSVIADLNIESDIENLVNCIEKVDGVVLNAGINKRQLSRFIKLNDAHEIVNTNLLSPVNLIKNLLKSRRIENSASILFISSISAYHGSIGDGVYSATKGGISSYAKVLALELASRKIRVNTIQPGMVRTDLMNHGPLNEEDYLKDEQRYPLGRYGKPEDIANASVFLLSDQSEWITGTDLVIDGGISLV